MSTSFPISQFGNELGQFKPAISLAEAPSDWLHADNQHISECVSTLKSREQLGIDGMDVVFPRFYVYTMAHLSSFNPKLVDPLKAKATEWTSDKDDITQLVNHRTVRDAIWDYLNRCGGTHFHDAGTEILVGDIIKLDTLCITARILLILRDHQRRQVLMDQQAFNAQSLLDLFQTLLDRPDLGSARPSIVRAVVDLSRKTGLYPECLIIPGVKIRGKEPVCGGSFGHIYKGKVAGQAIAIKVMRVSNATAIEGALKVFSREAVLWRQLSNPNVLPFYGVYRSPETASKLCFVSPWMENGNITQYLEKTPTADRGSLVMDIARGLDYLHSFEPPVIHGDLRGANILITASLRACVAGFGLATLEHDDNGSFTSSASSYGVGALFWIAPELLSYCEGERRRTTLASDVYSFGCVCHEIYTGYPKFANLSFPGAITAVTEGRQVPRPTHPELDDTTWELVEQCWAIEPLSRPLSSEVVHKLRSHLTNLQGQESICDWNEDISLDLHSELVREPSDTTNEDGPWPITDQDMVVAVMGPTGAGKTSFINIAMEKTYSIGGHNLSSCTQEVRAFKCPHPRLEGRNVIFVDTPGFDDTHRTEYDILKEIAKWLETTQRNTLSGILFFHSISESRKRGAPPWNLSMFEELCGVNAHLSVILTTTMWDEVSVEVGARRGGQLRNEFWGPMISHGCRIAHFESTWRSAWGIVNALDPWTISVRRLAAFHANRGSNTVLTNFLEDFKAMPLKLEPPRTMSLDQFTAGLAQFTATPMQGFGESNTEDFEAMPFTLERFRPTGPAQSTAGPAQITAIPMQVLGEFKTPISLGKAPNDWLRENSSQILKFMLNRGRVHREINLICPRLFVYTLVQLELYEPSQVESLKAEYSEWDGDEIAQLINLDSIMTTLYRHLSQCEEKHHYDAIGRDLVPKILKLDALCIAARILVIFKDHQRRKLLLEVTGSQAQLLLDLLQELLDSFELGDIHSPIVRIIVEFSKSVGLYPTRLILRNLTIPSGFPSAGGAFGDVFTGGLGGRVFAVKMMRVFGAPAAESLTKAYSKEAVLWAQLSSPYVLPFCGVYNINEPSPRMGLVSPWMDHGTLTHYLKNNSQANRLSLMLDVALGLEYLHSFDPTVIHGDLKGANVLITNDLRACVADFGLCVLAHDSNMQFAMTSSSNGKGSIPWMAPELLNIDTGGQIRKTCASDIYAFGGIGYEIFSGKPPFSELSPYMIIRAITENRPLPRPASAELDDDVWGLIEACRGEDPESRPKASEAVQQLRSHPTVRDREELVWDHNKIVRWSLLSNLAAPDSDEGWGKLPVPHLI